VRDESFYLLFNGWDQGIEFTLPSDGWARSWDLVLDSSLPAPPEPSTRYETGSVVEVAGHHFVLLHSR
jgi:hypothetical protein